MSSRPTSTPERYELFEAHVASTRSVLNGEEIQEILGERALQLLDCLDNLTFVNNDDSSIGLSDELLDSEAICVSVLRPGEVFFTGPNFAAQTPRQKQNAIRFFAQLEPIGMTAEEFQEQTDDSIKRREAREISLTPESSAEVKSRQLHINGSRLRHILGVPIQGVMEYAGRPTIILPLASSKAPSPDVLAHEMTHCLQRIDHPVNIFPTQKSFDMHLLRMELEAYHVGFEVILQSFGRVAFARGKDLAPEYDNYLSIETLRQQYNDEINPYRPSPPLLRELNAIGNLFPGRIDVAALQSEE